MSKKDYWVAGIFTLVIFVVVILFSWLFVLLAFAVPGCLLFYAGFGALRKGELTGATGWGENSVGLVTKKDARALPETKRLAKRTFL